MNKYYVTNSIAYINGDPHIGFAQETLAADVVARYHRDVLGDDTYFQTGADEHGFSVQIHAQRAGMESMAYVESLIGRWTGLKDVLNLTYDDFVRTTSKEHQKNVQELWTKALENGYIYKKHYSGVYCVGCEAMKNKSELIDGKCPNHPNLVPEVVEEENWFFKLSEFGERLKKYYSENLTFVTPDYRFNEIKSLVESGLEDVSISRPKEKLEWGIEVPNDPNHVMYVWFDALTNYLMPAKYWPADLHIIGKDILRFHAALWPAMLMAAGYSDDQLPKKVHVHGFISVDGQKMSKTLGNVVNPKEMVEKYGVDATRYLLLRGLSFDKDSDFSWERMTQMYNADLANDLGNLMQRTLTMINKYAIKPQIPMTPPAGEAGNDQKGETKNVVNSLIGELKFADALVEVWKIIQEQNKLIEESKPWELAKTDTKKLEEVLGSIYESLQLVAELILPVMPKTSEKMKKQLESLQPEAMFLRILDK